MKRLELFDLIKRKESFLCVGLDSDIRKIPPHLREKEDPVFEFNKQIIEATLPYTIAYKPNTAFYESRGSAGWICLEKTIQYLKQYEKEVFIIADGKRGDIGNTSKQYANAFFQQMDVDALTVAPYMGEDSVTPFLNYEEKWVILLALTSNDGAYDFQFLQPQFSSMMEKMGIRTRKQKIRKLFEHVLAASYRWGGSEENMMFVVGATKAEMLKGIRQIVPQHFLLIPGVGAQGGDLEQVAEFGMNAQCGLIVNSSRGIIFASNQEDFATKAGEKAQELQKQMKELLQKNAII
ncbi:MAG: orotidine-5'-phosphate decarboxylase [Bacteroidetes bacterium]|nr:MAG: orotidine-5'-phosphate decarboxylase [Bacteroidota bacterium]